MRTAARLNHTVGALEAAHPDAWAQRLVYIADPLRLLRCLFTVLSPPHHRVEPIPCQSGFDLSRCVSLAPTTPFYPLSSQPESGF